jgi:hypothetical protein
MISPWRLQLAFIACVVGIWRAAYAEEPEPSAASLTELLKQPVSFAERPLTLPERVLEMDAGLDVFHAGPGAAFAFVPETLLGLRASARYGLTDDLLVAAQLPTLYLTLKTAMPTNNVDYADPSLTAAYRLLRGRLEIGLLVTADLPIHPDRNASLRGGVPVLIRIDRPLRLDITPTFTVYFTHPLYAEVEVPIRLSINPSERVSFGMSIELQRGIIGSPFPSKVVALLAFFGAYTVSGGSGPIVDIGPTLTFPLFFDQSLDRPLHPVLDLWVLSLVGSFYCYAF